MPPLPRRSFAGKEVSVIGVGCSPFGHAYGTPDEKLALQAVHDAYENGVNFFDVAPFYGAGSAERLLGRCIQDLPRDDLFICTKVGKYKPGESEDFSGERVTRSVHESLERLGLKYIDLIICHDIESAVDMKQIVTETIPALQKLKEQGLIRAIGISGLPLDIFSYVLDRVPQGTVDAVLSYCHDNLADDTLQGLVPYLQKKGVKVISASFSSMGLLTQKAPPEWHPASLEVKAAADKARAICAEKGTDLATISLKRFMRAEGIDVRLMGMATPDEVAHDVRVVRQALGLEESPNARVEEDATQEIENLFKPVLNQTWKTGRDNNRTP